MQARVWWEDLRERGLYGGRDEDGRIILKWISWRWVTMLVTGQILLVTGTNGELMQGAVAILLTITEIEEQRRCL